MIISQYTKILNHYATHLETNILLHVNFTSVHTKNVFGLQKKKEEKPCVRMA